MNLFGGCYAPITDVIGFLEADFANVVAADTQWRNSLGGYRGRPVGGALSSMFEGLLPLTGPLLKYVWVETTGPWTAYFDNFVHGSDPFGPVSYLAKQMGCRSVAIGCRQATYKRGASVRFSLYGPIETDWVNEIRSVATVQDNGRWE